MIQTYVWPKYRRGIGQIDNNTQPAFDEQQEVCAGCTDQCQMVNYELIHEDALEDHKRLHGYVIA